MNDVRGRRIAFLIGNQIFPGDSRLSRLHGPENDVEALRGIFTADDLGQFDEVKPFVDRERNEILVKLEEVLSETERSDFVLIYYAGHGFTDNYGKLFLATKDTRAKARYATSIPGDHLKNVITQSKCQTVALILDCCYSGAIDSNTRGDIDESVKRTLATNGLFILTASTSIETAAESEVEDGKKRMGRFTAAIVNGIESGEADGNRDGLISLSDLAEWTQKTVRGQEPRFWAVNAKGDPTIAFARSEGRARLKRPVSRPSRVRLLFADFKRSYRASRRLLYAVAIGIAIATIALSVVFQDQVEVKGPFAMSPDQTINFPFVLHRGGTVEVSMQRIGAITPITNGKELAVHICSESMGGKCPYAQLAESVPFAATLPRGPGFITVYNFASNPTVNVTMQIKHSW